MRFYLLLWLSIFYIYSFSQTPTTPPLINYQGIARNAAGMPITSVTNPSISIRFEIYATLNGGTAAFSELQQNIPLSNLGLFSTQIGKNTGNFGTVNWATGTWYLEVFIDINNSANPTASLGRQQLVSVPYALYAEKAGSAPAPSVSYTNNILNVGGNTATITGNNYTAGNGIDISNGVISSTAVPSITLTGTGLATVSPSVSSIFNISVPSQSLSLSSGSVLSSNLGGSINLPLTTITPSTNIGVTGNAVNGYTITNTAAGSSSTSLIAGNTNIQLIPGLNSYTLNPYSYSLSANSNTLTLSNGAGGSITSATVPLSNGLLGSGTTSYIPVFSGTNSVSNSVMYQNTSGGITIGQNFTPPPANTALYVTTQGAYDNRILITGGDNNNFYGGILSFAENQNLISGMSIKMNAVSNKLFFTNDLNGASPVMAIGGYGGGSTNGVVIGTNSSYWNSNSPQDGLAVQGNVGIGVIAPAAKLDVLGSAGDIVRFTNSGTTNTNAVLNVNNSGTNGGTGINVTHTTGVGINVNTSGAGNLINITTSGGGIGLNATTGGNNAVNAINNGANPAINANNGGNGGAITAQSNGNPATIAATNVSSGNAISATNNSGVAPTLLVTNSGNHNAISASNNSNLQPTILLQNNNTGNGVVIQASNNGTGNTANFYNNGTGDIIYANKSNPATGRVAYFTNTNTGNTSPVIDVQNQGSGPAVNLFSGATSAIALQISDGHIKSSGGSPMLGTYNFSGFIGGSVGFGGSITGTDIKGNLSFYTPNGYTGINTGAYISQIVNFNKNYTIPPTVILTPINDLQGLNFMVFNTTISSFEVRVYRSNNGAVGPTSGPLNALLKFNYFVIE